VPMGALPGNAAAVSQAMANTPPTPFPILLTPTECGMRGMVNACVAHQAATGVQCVAVLVTDGEPTLCNIDGNVLSGIASAARAQGVPVFTVGMAGANLALLDAIATAGGTDCAPADPARSSCDVAAGQTAIRDALNAIRQTVTVTETITETITERQTTKLECQWKLPPPPDGEAFDKDRVNVKLSSAAMAAGVEYLRVPAEADCAALGDGWYYDDPAAPTEIRVCPATCTTIQATSGARVDILLGCATKEAVIE